MSTGYSVNNLICSCFLHYVKRDRVQSFYGLYSPAFGFNAGIHFVDHRSQSKCRKIQTAKLKIRTRFMYCCFCFCWYCLISQKYILFNHLAAFPRNQIEAVVRRCFSKWVLLKISQISRENTCIGVSF